MKPKRRIWPFITAAVLVVVAACVTAGILLSHSGPGERAAGNTPGNLANNGLAAQQGEWVYYIGVRSQNDGAFAIYKAHLDGTSQTKLPSVKNSLYMNLNVSGDWIYYLRLPPSIGFGTTGYTIEKMRTDGTGCTRLLHSDSVSLAYLTLMNGKLYFAKVLGGSGDEAGLQGFYRMNTDGSGQTKLPIQMAKTENFTNVLFADGWVYYLDNDSRQKTWTIEKTRTDGTGKTVLLRISQAVGNINSFVVSGGNVYYTAYQNSADTQYIGKVSINGAGQKTLLRQKGGIYEINAAGGYVYYTSVPGLNNYSYCRVKTDGKGVETLLKGYYGSCNSIVGNRIYFINNWSENEAAHFFRVGTNGKNLTKLN